jgi:hypothetical protein
MIRDGRVSGARAKNCFWSRVAFLGEARAGHRRGRKHRFCEDAFRETIDCSLEALRGIGARSVAIALPGRDIDLIRPERPP